MKRFDGKDEPIQDPDLPIVDAHHHLHDKPGERYLLDDYLADANSGHRIIGTVYVETLAFARATGPELMRALGEVEFANGIGAIGASGHYGNCRVCAGIVGYADLRLGDEVGRLLDACMAVAPDRYRGIRQVTLEHPSDAYLRYVLRKPDTGILSHPNFEQGLGQVAKRDLVFDTCIFYNQIPEISRYADRFPNLRVVLNHIGFPINIDLRPDEYQEMLATWKSNLANLAKRENVAVKIGGLGMPWMGFEFEKRKDVVSSEELARAWRPLIETTVEIFGTKRAMMESNMPLDGRTCGFVPLWNALKLSVSGASASEKADLFHRTAIDTYRLDLSDVLLG